MTTIFQMGHEELASLLHFLRPTLEYPHSADLIRLRMLITEWLLLNGLSTMHKFEKIYSTHDALTSGRGRSSVDETKWQMPNKIDCSSCGKYRVGRNMPIKPATNPNANTNAYYEEDEENPKVIYGGTQWDIQTPRFIKSKYGNLNRVYYLDSEAKFEKIRNPIKISIFLEQFVFIHKRFKGISTTQQNRSHNIKEVGSVNAGFGGG